MNWYCFAYDPRTQGLVLLHIAEAGFRPESDFDNDVQVANWLESELRTIGISDGKALLLVGNQPPSEILSCGLSNDERIRRVVSVDNLVLQGAVDRGI